MNRVEPPVPVPRRPPFYDNLNSKSSSTSSLGNTLELPVKLAGSLGMRREEICGLKWDNVDLQRRLVIIREARTAYGANIVQKETKNRASVRTPYLADELCLLLEQEQSRQEALRCQDPDNFNP